MPNERQIAKEHLKTSLISLLGVAHEAGKHQDDQNLFLLLGNEVEHFIEKLDAYMEKYVRKWPFDL